MPQSSYSGPDRRTSTCPSPACREPEFAAHAAAEKAVRQVFAIMGVDVENPSQVEEFREGLRFGRAMLRMANRGVLAFIVVAAGGAAAAIWLGIKIKIAGSP